MADKNAAADDTIEKHATRIIRVFDAPLKLVWDAWTDPVQVAQWWGPRGFTITTHSKDLRPGGHWNYTMHGPDGVDWPNVTQYHEVEPYRKLVYDHGASADRPALFRVTVFFSETGGKTTMDMTMSVPTAEALAEMRKVIRKANGNSTWDRLGEYLSKETVGKERFFISRTFETSVDKMFSLWTDPRHLAQWNPPSGFTMEFKRCEIRSGGEGFYAMSGNGVTMYGRVKYIEIRRPDLLIYTQQFADEQGNVSRHPMAPTWPETMLTTVTLASEGPNQTRVTVMWEPFGNATAEEVATFVKARTGMMQGWTGSFDKLESYAENA